MGAIVEISYLSVTNGFVTIDVRLDQIILPVYFDFKL